ncbi:MAG: hypothetical protein QOC65_1485 [Sphingomonadales bacterium]|nr:hypothetical protein [Sphingomonadales bacterium]
MTDSSSRRHKRRQQKLALAGVDSAVVGPVQPNSRPGALDEFLLPRVNHLRELHRRGGDPFLIRSAAIGLAQQVDGMLGVRSSLQHARLQSLIADSYLEEGYDAYALEIGLGYAEAALETIGRVSRPSNELVQARAYVSLQRGVMLKALGRFEESIRSMSRERKWLTARVGATDLDTIPLSRQEVLMRQELTGFAQLSAGAPAYSQAHPAEYYRTIKRVFEFCLNRDLVEDARALFPHFCLAFRLISQTASVLSHVSHAKNVGHYRLVTGDALGAVRLWKLALEHARALHLHGQCRQLEALLAGALSNDRAKLIPFFVPTE